MWAAYLPCWLLVAGTHSLRLRLFSAGACSISISDVLRGANTFLVVPYPCGLGLATGVGIAVFDIFA
jgi:cation transport ATPase